VIVRVSAPGILGVERTLAVRIAALAMKCSKGQLTREGYKVKRKQLEELLKDGTLTQKDFDRYDADLIACLP
jgi:hypothetical protein